MARRDERERWADEPRPWEDERPRSEGPGEWAAGRRDEEQLPRERGREWRPRELRAAAWRGRGRRRRAGIAYGEDWGADASGPSFGAGGMYGGAGGTYGGASGGDIGGLRRGAIGYPSRGRGGRGPDEREPRAWQPPGGWEGERGGWRDTSRDFALDLRRYAGEERGALGRMGERMRAGLRRLTGRAPKGYRRSDERIREDVHERIARSRVNAEEVEVEVRSGEVTLGGFVWTREEKRRLEEIAEDVFGVEEVSNRIRLHRREGHRPTSAQPEARRTSYTGPEQGPGRPAR